MPAGTPSAVKSRPAIAISNPAPHLRDCSIVRPDIIFERVCGLHLFSGETDRGRQWLESRAATDKHQRLGKSLGVEDERDARDLVDAAVADGLDVME